MGRRLALAVFAVASSGLACAGVIGLGDFEIVDAAADGAVASLPEAATPDGPVAAPDDSGCAVVVLDKTTLDFGAIHDNVTSAPLFVTFTNNGSSPVTVTGFTGGTADFRLPTTPFTILPGRSETESIVMTAGTASDAGTPVSATVSLTTDVPLCAVPTLTFTGSRTNQDITINPVLIDLGMVPCLDTSGVVVDAGVPVTGSVTIQNYGTLDAMFQASPPSDFQISATSGTVPQAGQTTLTVGIPNPGTLGPLDESLQVTVNAAQVTQATIQLQANVVGAVVRPTELTLNFSKPDEALAIPLPNTGNTTICVAYALVDNTGNEFTLSTMTDTIAAGASGTLKATWNGLSNRAVLLTTTPVACAGAAAPTAVCRDRIPPIDLVGR